MAKSPSGAAFLAQLQRPSTEGNYHEVNNQLAGADYRARRLREELAICEQDALRSQWFLYGWTAALAYKEEADRG